MKLTDGKRTIEINCYDKNGVDYSNYLLNSDNYELSEDEETYLAEDVQNDIDYVVEQFTKNYELYKELEKKAEEQEVELQELINSCIINPGDWGPIDEEQECRIYELVNGEWERIAYINCGEVEE